jgi:hypothetical protein
VWDECHAPRRDRPPIRRHHEAGGQLREPRLPAARRQRQAPNRRQDKRRGLKAALLTNETSATADYLKNDLPRS